MKENKIPDFSANPGSIGEKILKKIAIIAGIFSCIICILMIANYLQLKKADPVNMKAITALVERLSQDPSDNELREEIRTLDLLSRKAYFTNQWQIRMGGYLLLAGIAIVIISLQWIKLSRKRDPVISTEQEELFLAQKKARNLVMAGGTVLLVTAMIFGFLAHVELAKKYKEESPLALNSSDTILNSLRNTDERLNSPDSSYSESLIPVDIDTINEHVTENNKMTSTVSSGNNYPTFRGPGGYALVTQENIPVDWDGPTGKNIRWKTPIPLSGYNSPVIWDDNIFLTGASESKREIYCIDKNSGTIKWTVQVSNIPESTQQTPKVSKETGYAAPTAAVNAQGVYAIFPNGDLISLDHNGKQLWAQNLGLPQNHYGHASSLMIYHNMLIIQFDQRTSARIFALNTATGETVWTTSRQVKVSWSSPILVPVGNKMQVITTAEPFVAGYDAMTGKELWKLDAISGEVGPSAAFANNIVFTVNDYSKLAAIQLGDQPLLLWENDEYLSDIPSPVANDKYVFLVTSYGVIACYDAQSGNKYWEKELNNQVYSSPVIAENRVYLIDRAGVTHIFKADKEFSSIGEPKLGEKSACTPAFSNGRIFLRGDMNLYCIGE